MPAVFVHGVPDTGHVWDAVRRRLPGTETVALSLPGFHGPLPDGFRATKEDYVAWIIARLEEFRAPVDLVGHDWGCLMTVRVASLRPDLVRTWAGGGGPVGRDYEWHPLAKLWQTPGVGERWMADLDPAAFGRQLEDLGVPAGAASEAAARVDGTMKDCILRLYRSAVTVGAEWEPGLAGVAAPGLVFWGRADPACPVGFADRLGRSVRASRVLTLDCGHWTPLQKPAEVAQALQEHWEAAG